MGVVGSVPEGEGGGGGGRGGELVNLTFAKTSFSAAMLI